jgi:N-methylhydantoinase A
VLVPRTSPAFSALGALAAAPSLDEERSYLTPAREADPARLRALFAELVERAQRALGEAGFAPERIQYRYQLSLRYPGQNWSLAIALAERQGSDAPGLVDAALRDRAIERFHRRHQEEYGHARPGEEPELTGVRLLSAVDTPKPSFGSGLAAAPQRVEPTGTRRANLGLGFAPTAIYRGPALRPGSRVVSPAIIEETYTTIAVYPGWEARVDDAGDWVLARLAAGVA